MLSWFNRWLFGMCFTALLVFWLIKWILFTLILFALFPIIVGWTLLSSSVKCLRTDIESEAGIIRKGLSWMDETLNKITTKILR